MKIKVKSSQPKPLPQPRRLIMPAQEGFITKFIRVILDDVNYKLFREKRQKKEEYEQFCKLARGEK